MCNTAIQIHHKAKFINVSVWFGIFPLIDSLLWLPHVAKLSVTFVIMVTWIQFNLSSSD